MEEEENEEDEERKVGGEEEDREKDDGGEEERRTRHNRHFSCGTAYASLSWSSSSTAPRPGVARPLFTRGTTVKFDLATAMFPIRTRPASRGTRPFPRSLETRSPVSGTGGGSAFVSFRSRFASSERLDERPRSHPIIICNRIEKLGPRSR